MTKWRIQMPHHQTFKDRNPTENLKRFSRAMHPMQFVREIYQNALEAGATKLRAYLEPQYLNKGAKKLAFADNGHGMTAHEMANLLGQYNSSSKSTGGVHDNFGIGVKATTLVNNPYGVVFLSWSKVVSEEGEKIQGNMMWFTYDEEASEVSIKPAEYIYGDDEEDVRCLHIPVPGWSTSVNVVNLNDLEEAFPNGWEGIKWWECKETAKIKRTGTVVMLLGESAEADSLPASWSQNTLSHYMSWRYENLAIDYIDDLRHHSIRSSRSLGLIQVLKSYIKNQDSLNAPNGTQLDIYYVDVPKQKHKYKTEHYCSTTTYRGFSAIAYKGELYHSRGDKINARSWGITADDVIEKIIIIVRPPILGLQADGSTRGVYPNDLRDRLLWQDSSSELEDKDFDLDSIKRWFVENQPKRLVDMIEKANAEDNSISRSQRARRELLKYADIFKHRSAKKGDRVVEDAQGDRPLPESPSQALQAAKTIHPDFMPKQTEDAEPKGRIDDGSNSSKVGRLKRSKTEIEIQFKWLHADDDKVKELLTKGKKSYPVEMSKQSPSTINVILNEDHELFEALYQKASREYVCSPADARAAVKDFYETDLSMYVYHISSLKRVDFSEFTTIEALHMRLLGTAWTIYPNVIRSLSKKGFHKR
jgi:hypothetical protein